MSKIECEKVGLSAMVLGGGRENKDSIIDLSVGIVLNKKVGDYVKEGETIATFHANDTGKLEDAIARFEGAYTISDMVSDRQKLIKYVVTSDGVIAR